MKNIIKNINKTFDNRVRLGIMSILSVNDKADFNRLKELLDVTDGNLASHIKTLVKLKYIDVSKQFVNNKPKTTYYITKIGKNEFTKHIKALEQLIKKQQK